MNSVQHICMDNIINEHESITTNNKELINNIISKKINKICVPKQQCIKPVNPVKIVVPIINNIQNIYSITEKKKYNSNKFEASALTISTITGITHLHSKVNLINFTRFVKNSGF